MRSDNAFQAAKEEEQRTNEQKEREKAAKEQTSVERQADQQSRILEVGPHGHNWTFYGTDGSGVHYEECSICKTRRARSAGQSTFGQQAWLDGGEWVGDDAQPTPMPTGPVFGVQVVDVNAAHEAQMTERDVTSGRVVEGGDEVVGVTKPAEAAAGSTDPAARDEAVRNAPVQEADATSARRGPGRPPKAS
jgi:hypothetical protein